MHLSHVVRRLLVLVSLLALVITSAAAGATSSGTAATAERPTATVVKRGLTKFWDTDQETSIDKITLKFLRLNILATRKAVPGRDIVESAWVTPVIAVFDQRMVRTSSDILNGGTIRSCFLYRVSFNGIFYKSDFGWTFKNRNTKTTRLSTQYRC
jgi:hypothetical protein